MSCRFCFGHNTEVLADSLLITSASQVLTLWGYGLWRGDSLLNVLRDMRGQGDLSKKLLINLSHGLRQARPYAEGVDLEQGNMEFRSGTLKQILDRCRVIIVLIHSHG